MKVTIHKNNAYMGLIGIQGLESQLISRIPEERRANGAYRNLEDFIQRTGIGLEQCIILIRLGALRFTGMTKKQLLWDVHNYLGQKFKRLPVTELFRSPVKAYRMPELPDDALESAYQELELLGYPLTLSMYALLKTGYRGEITAENLLQHVGETVKLVGNYVCEKLVRTKNNKKMWFGTFLDREGGWFDTVHFPDVTSGYPFRGKGCYLILGKVVAEFGSPSIEVMKFAKLPIKDNPVTS